MIDVRLFGLFQLLVGAIRENDTFSVRLVLLDGILQVLDRCVSLVDIGRHRPHGDVHQLAGLLDRADLVLGGRHQALHGVGTTVRRFAGDDFKQNRTQQIGVAVRADFVQRAGRHFRRHVGRGSAHAAGLGNAAGLAESLDGLGEPPVHQQHFAVTTEHDVFGFQIAMHHAAGMGKADRIGHVVENGEILFERFVLNDVEPGRAFHSLHGIKQRAGIVAADVVNRHDVRVIEIAGDHRFGEELEPLVGIFGDLRLEHLNGDRSIDRRLLRQIHDAHAAFAEYFDQFVLRFLRPRFIGFNQPTQFDDERGFRGSLGRLLELLQILCFDGHPRRDVGLVGADPRRLHCLQHFVGQIVGDECLFVTVFARKVIGEHRLLCALVAAFFTIAKRLGDQIVNCVAFGVHNVSCGRLGSID